jgi:cytidyltransferase-like protein
MRRVVVSGSFDNPGSASLRLLEEASKLGPVRVLMGSDEVAKAMDGKPPKFPQEERLYFLRAVRYVEQVTVWDHGYSENSLPLSAEDAAGVWFMEEGRDTPARRDWCRAHGLDCVTVNRGQLKVFPPVRPDDPIQPAPGRTVIVTGCYDWFHSGHIRFFEEVAALGSLYVVIGGDANVRLLKGEGHPLFAESERRYVVSSIRHVHQALVSTGTGWMDAEPEIARIHPDIYAVNEDGDKPEKREFCRKHGLEYVILKRAPKEGLPRRQSTDLRGF